MSTKLSPRNVFLIALAACLLIIGLWYMMRYQPRQQRITELSGELETLNSRVVQLRSDTAQLPAMRERVAKLKIDQQQFLAALPSTTNMNTVLNELALTTAATGAKMNNFTVQAGTSSGLPGGVRPIGLNLGLTGTFSQLFQTLRSVETMGRFSTVNSLSLQMPTATTFDPKLEGTLAMTVYTFDPALASASATSTGTPQAPAAPAAPASPSGGTQ